VAGASSPPALIERLDAAGLTVLNLYGMTEIGAAASVRPDDPPDIRRHTSGRALRGHELRVVDGELQVRGSHVSPGYFRQPERTATAFDGEWLRTGDLGSLDSDGNLTVLGRLDDLVTVAGFNVSPAEVESCLLEHPDLVGAVIVGLPDERLGHRLAAFVVRRDGSPVRTGDVLRHVRGRLAGYKVPYRVEFMDDLPRLATGKPDRQAIQQMALSTGP
jgi:acyl-CoA synthetase (AMP-forming)/AMP-acid ligase II